MKKNLTIVRFNKKLLVSFLFFMSICIYLFIPLRAKAMDKNPTPPGRNSLDMQSLETDSDISDSDVFAEIWNCVVEDPHFLSIQNAYLDNGLRRIPTNISQVPPDISNNYLVESDVLRGIEASTSKSPCKRARLTSTSIGYKPPMPNPRECYQGCQIQLPSVIKNKEMITYKEIMSYIYKPVTPPSKCFNVQAIPSFKHKTLKQKEEEKLQQSEIYSSLKPKLGRELAKTHTKSNTKPAVKIARLYKLPTELNPIYWEKAAQHFLGMENEIQWKQKIKEVETKRKNSDFYRTTAEWLIDKKTSQSGWL